MNDRMNSTIENHLKEVERARIEKEVHTEMLEMLAGLAPENKRPIFLLPVKASHVTSKIGNLMMLALQTDDEVGYAVKACEFLDRVEEACDAFVEQADATEENNGGN